MISFRTIEILRVVSSSDSFYSEGGTSFLQHDTYSLPIYPQIPDNKLTQTIIRTLEIL